MSPFVAPDSSFKERARQQAAPKIGDRRRYIHFYGESFADASLNYSIDVLAGDQPPTITDGYAQWTPIARPLRSALMVFTGYGAITMQLALRFMLFNSQGSWLTDDNAGAKLETQIEILEWMAGMGSSLTGPSPLVFLSTYDQAGDTNALIPFEYQSPTPSVPRILNGNYEYAPSWVITALAWDTAPVRNANGWRVRQDATVTASMYDRPAGAPSHGQPRPKGTMFVSRDGNDTALKIARAVPAQDPYKTAYAIIKAAQNKHLRLRAVSQLIKHGRRVFVPPSVDG